MFNDFNTTVANTEGINNLQERNYRKFTSISNSSI